MIDKNLSIKIPDQFYCGFVNRHEDEMLGFMTPQDDSKAFEKRKETVDRWRDKKIEPISFKNELLSGFRLDRDIKRYGWNGGNSVIRLEDPRGFEVEISVANLCKIIENNTIRNGIIENECIWGRDGNRNILLAKNSKPYLDAIQNSERLSKSVSLKDVNPGNIILLKNGTKGQYLGKVFPIQLSDRKNDCWTLEVSKKIKHLLYVNEEKLIQSSSSLNVSEILSNDENWLKDESEKRITDLSEQKEIAFRHRPLGFTFSSKNRIQLDLIHLNKDRFDRGIFKSYYLIAKDRETGLNYLFETWYRNREDVTVSRVSINNNSISVIERVIIRSFTKRDPFRPYYRGSVVELSEGQTVFDRFEFYEIDFKIIS